ncbi:basic membrane protein A [Rubricella aquisinus]|uniref:Basic membrane protein A n=1 Tax=Rubricella aquisinus TaxID=2028108 RepID=A0A840X306_9RHOB|nr:BMP family ABC transporter substrate-binding protein [Rubricella aquisinus]MBB5515057.1 basic membrane protein A [Rubricella aquisinus]
MILRLLIAVAILFPAAVHANGPAVVYDGESKFDASFNESAFNGAELFRDITGQSYAEATLPEGADRVAVIRELARAGHGPIVAVGFNYGEAVNIVAGEFPNTSFAIIDMVVDRPNVRSVVFREHEGSYLVGMAAALSSESGTVGFVGGMDIPIIRRFACGFAGGVRAVDPDTRILVDMTGTTPAAFNDPEKGEALAKAQIADGADVIYHASGGTGVGVLQAVADAGVLGIGVDMNQNHMQPGRVLTSMLKQVDYAVFFAFQDALDGAFTGGIQSLGLEDRGVGFAVDQHNSGLMSGGMVAQIENAGFEIINGQRAVHDFTTDGTCPYLGG